MIQRVWIKQVRNLDEVFIDLTNSKHCFINGNNNQGKTSILEAISLAIDLKSPLQDDLDKVLQEEKDSLFVGIDFEAKEKERWYLKYKRNGKKEIYKNSKLITKTSQQDYFCEYISADALHIFQKDPDFRRKLLDRFCCLKSNDYEVALKSYEKQLRQKNKYLKQEKVDIIFLKTLNAGLAKQGAVIVLKRQEALVEIQEKVNEIIHEMQFIEKKVEIVYEKKRIENPENTTYEDIFYKTLNEDMEKERILKYTLSGPHRDDFKLLLASKYIFDFYSRGINRSFAILFQLAQILCLKDSKTCLCLLLDDTLAEIDHDNKEKILSFMKRSMQLFYATTKHETALIEGDEKLVVVKKGKVVSG
ncbi:hypothetical protein CL657_02560 [bacterium]|nr:hypothetical protein [bacterium]